MCRTRPTIDGRRFPRPLSPCRLRLEALEDRTLPSILTVTSTADSGPGSLRAEISAASSGDTINFNLPNHSTIHLTSGTLNVNQQVAIQGPGASALTVAGNGTFTVFGFFATGLLSGVTVTGGNGQFGGGVFISGLSGTSLNLNHCIIKQNMASGGGGIYQEGAESLTITDCVISSNVAVSGGGLFNSGGSITITNSMVSGNNAGTGGGIYSAGTMLIQASSISGNVARGAQSSDASGGGIISAGGVLVIHDSSISGNSAIGGDDGGGGGGRGLGGGINCQGSASIVGSTIAGNLATGGDGAPIAGSNAGQGLGGGIWSNASSLALANCTIVGNVARGGSASGGQGGDGAGGGIWQDNATAPALIAINCTMAANHAIAGTGSSGSGLGELGGLSSLENFVLQNTIVAANTATTDRPDIGDNTGNNSVFNLIGDGTGSNLTNGSNGNQVGNAASPIDPKLNVLANYGGPTQTMSLLPGSPAIDRGANYVVTMDTDQRGYARIFNSSIDIGAYEFQPFHFLAVGADLGHTPEVKVYDAMTGFLRLDFNAYEASFKGGVRVAIADMNGDGVPDIITAPGGVKVTLVNVNGALVPAFDTSAGRAPEIKVFSGIDGSVLDDFIAYTPTFRAGLFVAVADVNGDGKPDIITAPDATGQSGHTQVSVFFNGSLINSGASLAPNRQFNAYDPGFGGGVRIAAADLNRDSFADIVVSPGIWSGPDIRVFDGKTLVNNAVASKVGEFLAYDFRYFGGVFVSTGDVNGDGLPDIVTGTNGNGGPEVKAFSGASALNNPAPAIIDDFFAYDPAFNGGARVAVMDVNGDGKADIVTGAGPGGGPHVRIFDGGTGLQLQLNTTDSFMAFDPSFSGGVFVGGA